MTSISCCSHFIPEIGLFCFILYTIHARLTIITVIAEVKKHVRPTLIPMVTGNDRLGALIAEEFNGNESSFITQSEEINGETEELKRLHGGQDCEGQRGQTVLGDTCGHLEATAQGIGVEVGHCGHD